LPCKREEKDMEGLRENPFKKPKNNVE